MERIIFCDKSGQFIDAISAEFAGRMQINRNLGIRKYVGNIREVVGNNYAYISPSNSFLFFDGGVDAAYSRMFPKLQETAQNLLHQYDVKSLIGKKYGRNYLPIGSALVVPVDDCIQNNYVIACPTMFRPQDIRGTRNVYYAFLAGLAAIDKYNKSHGNIIKTVVSPGLGTGYGKEF